MNQTEQMRELEAKVRAQANLIKAMEQKQSHLSAQKAKWEEATRTLESEREANRISPEELEQAKQALAAEPAPLVRLTDEEIDKCYGPATRAFKRFKYSVRGQMSMPQDSFEWHFANAIMDAMIAKNGGSDGR